MLKNYIKIAIRNILRHKFYTAINVLGLAIGIACFLMIAMWVQDEVGYDRHFKNAEHIYRIENILITAGIPKLMATADCRLAEFVRDKYPEVKAITRALNTPTLLTYNGKSYYEKNTFYTDTTFFDVFAFRFIEGEAHTALRVGTIVINESVAHRLFGTETPIGKTLYLNNIKTGEKQVPRIVTGVIKDVNKRSHYHPAVIIGRTKYMESFEQTYALFNPGYTVAQFERQVWQPLHKNFFEADYKGDRQSIGLSITPLTKIHLTPDRWGELERNGNLAAVYTFSIIGLLILLIASINYTNLTTARSYSRAREVGIRKLFGATKGQLVTQFLTESIIIALLATILGFSLIEQALPFFNHLSGKAITLELLSAQTIAATFVLTVAVGCISGMYPAFFISSFPLVKALKGTLNPRNKPTLRKSLVVIQFALSIVTLIATIVVARQLDFVKNSNLGFDKEQVLVVNINDPAVKEKTEILKNELKKNPGILTVAASCNMPGEEMFHSYLEYESPEGMKTSLLNAIWADYDYPKLLDLKMVEGTGFDSSMLPRTDTELFAVMTESAVKKFGWDHGYGKKVQSGLTYGFRKGRCVGVVKDFHSMSLREQIEPLYFILPSKKNRYTKFNYLSIKVKGGNIPAIVNEAKRLYKSYSRDYPFEYSFLDDDFDKQYHSEEQQHVLFNWFAGLCILISCLGLMGLTSFSTKQRTKEISIRKISGASVTRIVLLLSKDFFYLVLIAFAIAVPTASYLMNKWLHNFAYHTTIGWEVYAMAGVIALIIAMTTISIHTIRAANKSPADTLKYE